MNLSEIGHKIYDTRKKREFRRYIVFRARGFIYRGRMKAIDDFFQSTPLLSSVADTYPFVYEQPMRAFFYHRSTFDERIALVENHMAFLAGCLAPDAMRDLYNLKEIALWDGIEVEGRQLSLELSFEPGQRKEGLLSVMLRYGGAPFYQIIFWIGRDMIRRSEEWAMYIGAMQGPNMDDAKDAVKKVTKACHAYRTKNLILYSAQAVARSLRLTRIYAVTNEGYYANNHVRADRKLKTDFSSFWIEAGGSKTSDERFDELPLIEPRKTMDEVPTRKRNVYRKRFALLDEIDAAIEAGMKNIMRDGE
ncbi:MAG: DUF535 domain-containing protein [Schwartzia sp.]|nr:DUF535 domain-containing protein [Schwartzia sp. (in: firmicutes)]